MAIRADRPPCVLLPQYGFRELRAADNAGRHEPGRGYEQKHGHAGQVMPASRLQVFAVNDAVDQQAPGTAPLDGEQVGRRVIAQHEMPRAGGEVVDGDLLVLEVGRPVPGVAVGAAPPDVGHGVDAPLENMLAFIELAASQPGYQGN